jgi:hypothetical protein
MNPFVVIAHNSDAIFSYDDCSDQDIRNGLEHPNCLAVFTQNPGISHPKIHLLPIGFANSKWPHGNPTIIGEVLDNKTLLQNKMNPCYFFFNEDTNRPVRIHCRIALSRKLKWNQHTYDFKQYLIQLASYKYAICPEGNGYDTHRLWECIYLQVIPVMKKSVFSDYVAQFLKPYPVIILDDWFDFDLQQLLDIYEYPNFPFYSIQTFQTRIHQIIHSS